MEITSIEQYIFTLNDSMQQPHNFSDETLKNWSETPPNKDQIETDLIASTNTIQPYNISCNCMFGKVAEKIYNLKDFDVKLLNEREQLIYNRDNWYEILSKFDMDDGHSYRYPVISENKIYNFQANPNTSPTGLFIYPSREYHIYLHSNETQYYGDTFYQNWGNNDGIGVEDMMKKMNIYIDVEHFCDALGNYKIDAAKYDMAVYLTNEYDKNYIFSTIFNISSNEIKLNIIGKLIDDNNVPQYAL